MMNKAYFFTIKKNKNLWEVGKVSLAVRVNILILFNHSLDTFSEI